MTLPEMPPLELSHSELNNPVSLTVHGEIVTVRGLIAEKGTPAIRRMFDINGRETTNNIRPVNRLDRGALKVLAIAMLKRSSPQERVMSISGGDYGPSDLIREVENETRMGQKIIRGVRLNGMLVENAIEAGRIRPRL